MRLKLLFGDNYQVVGVMDGDACETETFLNTGEETTRASREGLLQILRHIANHGLQNSPTVWVREANKKERIYEFRKGDLRLFFFKGDGNQIAVCTSGVLKKGQKADKAAVNKAAALRKTYIAAVESQTIEVIEDEDQ